MIDYEKIKPLLFKFQPETAHHIVEVLLKSASSCPALLEGMYKEHFVYDESLKQNLFGRVFFNPVGLGAGFDKNATMIDGIKILGFGYSEIGTITYLPQEGNPKPRMFRHIEEKTIQNAMGFNNDGAKIIFQRVKKSYPHLIPIGINIGKNKTTPEDKAIDDYIKLLKTFKSVGDYFVINISSPNTPGLRDLQNENFIKTLFSKAKEITTKPILLKIAPDMTKDDAVSLTSFAVECGANGIIATNTTIDYSLVKNPKDIGGLSGKVLREKSFEIFEAIAKELFGKTTLISVGGIDNAQEAYKRIKAGASLVQVLSALVFEGPDLVMNINKGLIELLKKDGYDNITQAIGADRK